MTIVVDLSRARDYYMVKNHLCTTDNPVTLADHTRVSNAGIMYIELVVYRV